jgi:hypothetical protein
LSLYILPIRCQCLVKKRFSIVKWTIKFMLHITYTIEPRLCLDQRHNIRSKINAISDKMLLANHLIKNELHNIKFGSMHDVINHIPIMFSDLILITTLRHNGMSDDVVNGSRMMSKSCC